MSGALNAGRVDRRTTYSHRARPPPARLADAPSGPRAGRREAAQPAIVELLRRGRRRAKNGAEVVSARGLTSARGRPRVTVVGEEKGIDVRISLDVIQMAIDCELDVALLLSQVQDFVELARDVRSVARRQGRWIKMASAYPAPSGATAERGVDMTDWIPIERATYEACLVPSGGR